jgi:cell division protein FtsI (penicillin-binding protein 3)
VVSRQGKEAYELTERKFKPGAMPDVTGMGIRDALYVLENAGLRVQVNGRGSVLRQSVTAGSPVQHGELVALELGL